MKSANNAVNVLLLMIAVLPFVTQAGDIMLSPVSTYPAESDPTLFGAGAAETVAFDAVTQSLLISNGADNTIDIVDIANPIELVHQISIDLTPYGHGPTDVAVHNGLAAVTVQNEEKTENGVVLLFDVETAIVGVMKPVVLEVGALPDALAFSPDGRMVVIANEGEPNDAYTVDPEGSVSIIDIASLSVKTADFRRFNPLVNKLRHQGIRIYGPNASVAEDLEPENVAVSSDATTAWVTLQENNAFAVIDLKKARVRTLIPAGYKFHLAPANSFDASDKDKAVNLQPWPVFGMYNPDGVTAFNAYQRTFYIVANEGDTRDYGGFSEEARVKDITLSSIFKQYWPGIQEDANLGRLKTTTAPPSGKSVDADGNEVYSEIFAYGGRSFSIWSAQGGLIYESHNDIEEILAATIPDYFNTGNDENKLDGRSDDKGPEPEGVCVGEVNGRLYGFVALERQGGVMAFDISNPWRPRFVHYANHRDYSGDPEAGTAGDLGPEDMVFISADSSPNGLPLLAVANEISGTTTLYQIDETP